MNNTKATASFVSSDTIQLRLELGTVIDAVQTTEIPTGITPNAEGWVYENGGYIGKVAGRNDEYWMPVDQFEQSPIADLFDRADVNGTLRAPADTLANWIVRVNGQRVDVEGISRKSNILDTAETGWFTFDFRTAENVFLDLAAPLQEGDTISVRYNDPDFTAVSQTYQPTEVISEAIHVNLAGFDPDDTVKTAYLSSWNGFEVVPGNARGGVGTPQDYAAGTTFQVIDEATGKVVKTGEIELNQDAADQSRFSGLNFHQTDVYKMDFSDVTDAGTYHVVVDGVGRSQSFEIEDSHWQDLFDISFSGFYHHRSGIALDAEYTDFPRDRSLHPDDGVVVQQSTVKLTDTSEGYKPGKPGFGEVLPDSGTGEILTDAWGGWHDAGDYDRRIQHIEASRKLIELVELEPDFAERAEGRIPESGDGIPDLLDEALWNLDLFRRLQKEDGGVPGGIESETNPLYGEGSWADSLELFAYAPEVWSTWEYASGAAKIANILKVYDSAAVQGWTDSAIAAMEWAEARVPSGADYDSTLNNARNLAAVELFNLTGDEQWHDVFKDTTAYGGPDLSDVTFDKQQFEAGFVYLRMDPSQTDAGIAALALEDLTREGDLLLNLGQASGFDYTVNPYAPYGWGNTAAQPNYSADAFMRLHALTGDQQHLDKLQEDVQYVLGANPLNMSYMTGIDGVRSPEEILNNDADVLGNPPPPGVTLYGDYNIFDYGYNFYHDIMANDVWPNYDDAPVSESFNGFTVFVPSAEYTVQQGITDMTAVTGYLAAQQADAGPITGTANNDILRGTNGNDTIEGRAGNDALIGGAGADTLRGDRGSDRAEYTDATSGVKVDLANAQVNTGIAAGDTFEAIESIRGSSSDDDLRGNEGVNRLQGMSGDDWLHGRGGADKLYGQMGDDVLLGGVGADLLNGGGGRDRAQYTDSNSGVVADLQSSQFNTGYAAGDIYQSIEDLRGSRSTDSLRGDEGANRIEGLRGNDGLIGRGGNDTLIGGAGSDMLRGGAGNDVLTGGSGRDIFDFRTPNEGIDRITDFEADYDRIRLNDATFDALDVGRLDAINFRNGASASDANDFIIYNAANGRLYYDADGAGGAAQVHIATLSNREAISENDFLIV
jgi:endoglucanase